MPSSLPVSLFPLLFFSMKFYLLGGELKKPRRICFLFVVGSTCIYEIFRQITSGNKKNMDRREGHALACQVCSCLVSLGNM